MSTNHIFFNQSFDKKRLRALIEWTLKQFGEKEALRAVEHLKSMGFENAAQAGISLGLHELTTPPDKGYLVSRAQVAMNKTEQDFAGARITATERSQRIVDTWHRVSETLREQVVQYFSSYDQLNPIYIMALSGARGNFSQVRQLVGMRGLMADPQGKIISFPIRSNLREGLTLTEYFISCSGARKGLVDTALRTADTGYLTRRLVDVSHHIVVKRATCHTCRGVRISELRSNNKLLFSLKDRLVGRVLAERISVPQEQIVELNLLREKAQKRLLPEGVHAGGRTVEFAERFQVAKMNPSTFGDIIANSDQEISPDLASLIAVFRREVLIRSPLTCAFNDELCQLCYGWSLAQGSLVNLGEAVGVIAAQSIGEPGTQLTMRTFHTGGVFSGDLLQEIRAPHSGKIRFSQAFQGLLIRTTHGKIAFLTKTPGEIVVIAPSHQKMHIRSSSAVAQTQTTFPPAATTEYPPQTTVSQTTTNRSVNNSNNSRLDKLSNNLIPTGATTNESWDTLQLQETVLSFQSFTMLFVRQGEQVEKDQLLAEISDLGEEGNQPIQSQQIIFAELSGKVVDIQTESAKNQDLGKTVNQENQPRNQIQPERSGRLGLFEILSTRVGASSNPSLFLKKGDSTKMSRSFFTRQPKQSSAPLKTNTHLEEKSALRKLEHRNTARLAIGLKPGHSLLAQTALNHDVFYRDVDPGRRQEQQLYRLLLRNSYADHSQGWAGIKKGFLPSQPLLDRSTEKDLSIDHLVSKRKSIKNDPLSIFLHSAWLNPKSDLCSTTIAKLYVAKPLTERSSVPTRIAERSPIQRSDEKVKGAGLTLGRVVNSRDLVDTKMISPPATGQMFSMTRGEKPGHQSHDKSKPFLPSSVYLRTIALNGDLVDEDYKNCAYSLL